MKDDLEEVNSWLKGEGSKHRGLEVACVFDLLESEKKALGAMFQYFLMNPSSDFIQSRQIKSRMDLIHIESMYPGLRSLIKKGFVIRETQNSYKLNWNVIRIKFHELRKDVETQQSIINVFSKYLMLYQSHDLEKRNIAAPYLGNDKFMEYVNRLFLMCFNRREKYIIYIVTREFSSLEEFGDIFKDSLSRASKRGIKLRLLFNVNEIEKVDVKRRILWLSQLENAEIRVYKSEDFSRDYSRIMVITKTEGELKADGLYSGITIGSKIAPMMPRAGTFYQNVIGLFMGPIIYETWIQSQPIKKDDL